RFVEVEALADAEAVFDECRRVAATLGLELRLPDEGETAADDDAPGCDWPWTRAYVTHDGRMQPCCLGMGTDRAVLGDVTQRSVRDNWHGDAYVSFRHRLRTDDPPEVCKGCSLYRR